jgi:hypothetical protein
MTVIFDKKNSFFIINGLAQGKPWTLFRSKLRGIQPLKTD